MKSQEPIFKPSSKLKNFDTKFATIDSKIIDLQSELIQTRSKLMNLGKYVDEIRTDMGKAIKIEPTVGVGVSPAVEQINLGSIEVQLADSVNTIVGLREAIKTKHRLLRYIWLFLVCLGVGATMFFLFETAVEYLSEPTSTNVKLISNSTYEYPPIILCPDGWLDVEKAESLHFSIDALKYSLGFHDSLKNFELTNRTIARKEFLKFYYARNYTSLRNFYKNMAVDLTVSQNLGELANKTGASYWCEDCNRNTSGEKIFLNSGVCYAFFLDPSEGIEIWSNRRKVLLKIPDSSKKIFPITSTWQVFFSNDLNLLFSPIPAITIQSFNRHVLKLSAQKFVTLNKDEAPCLAQNKVPYPDYSAESCVAMCRNQNYKKSIGCQIFLMSSGLVQEPTEFCNYFDPLPGNRSMTVFEFFASDGRFNLQSDAAKNCINQCPPRCEKILYEAALDAQVPLGEFDPHSATENVGSANATDMNIVSVEIVHSAAYQGGVLTLVEMNTYSFTSFVNNVGGTLGLFVGGTLMTLVQLVMFFVTWVWDKRRA